jgi:hypothetical protein
VGRAALSLADVAATGAYTDLVGAPAAVTAASLGLDQVDNTADVDKPISTAVASALSAKAATAALATVATSGAYSDLIGAPAGGTETTATLGGTGATGVELMESATPTVARAALVLGTAATTDASDYATAAQGVLADSATQPADLSGYATTASLGTAATTDASDYATAAQGVLAGTAVQPADLAAAPLTGTGSPQGVIAATVGTTYADTAGTTGAWEWIKTSGTGTTTGWVVKTGDTGLRNIDSLIQAPAEGIGERIARVGNTVTLYHAIKSDTAWASAPVLYLPAGFNSQEALLRLPPHYQSGFGVSTLYSTNLRWNYTGTAPWCYAQWTWRTNDPWPTVLPGTAV